MSDKPVFDKSNLPSRHVSVGAKSAPHRSYYYAMGMTEEEINQPLIGVATTWNEAAPCNISLARQAPGRQARRARPCWQPPRIYDHYGNRWYCHGSCRHESLTG